MKNQLIVLIVLVLLVGTGVAGFMWYRKTHQPVLTEEAMIEQVLSDELKPNMTPAQITQYVQKDLSQEPVESQFRVLLEILRNRIQSNDMTLLQDAVDVLLPNIQNYLSQYAPEMIAQEKDKKKLTFIIEATPYIGFYTLNVSDQDKARLRAALTQLSILENGQASDDIDQVVDLLMAPLEIGKIIQNGGSCELNDCDEQSCPEILMDEDAVMPEAE